VDCFFPPRSYFHAITLLQGGIGFLAQVDALLKSATVFLLEQSNILL